MSAGLDENLNQKPQVKVGTPSQDCQMEQMLREKRSSARDGPKTLEKVYKSKGLGFLWKALSRHPRQVQKALKTSSIHNPGLHFLRKALFKRLVIYTYTVYIFLGKPKPEEAVYNNQVACTCEDIEFSERSTSRGCKIGRQRVQVL